jgi:hypothetical protein
MGKKFRYWDQFLMKVIKIELHPDNMNKEDVFSLKKAVEASCPLPEEREGYLQEQDGYFLLRQHSSARVLKKGYFFPLHFLSMWSL